MELILTKQIPADISFLFHPNMQDYKQFETELYEKVYKSYFGDNDNSGDSKILKQYKPAKCNQYCTSLKYPEIAVSWADDKVDIRLISAKFEMLCYKCQIVCAA